MLDLTTAKDHPVKVLAAWLDQLPPVHAERPGGYRSQEVLSAYERESGVTFAALDNDALAALRQAYDYPDDVDDDQYLTALREVYSLVGDLLGLGD